ncbi:hypothetical protein AB5N19_07918 [Seiridium cardinale]|uniref:Uncharacterized protein n=1 Tax=Seiridium cardinale TaxID=138064 RepID=A0ABR2Y1J3_9PEZI
MQASTLLLAIGVFLAPCIVALPSLMHYDSTQTQPVNVTGIDVPHVSIVERIHRPLRAPVPISRDERRLTNITPAISDHKAIVDKRDKVDGEQVPSWNCDDSNPVTELESLWTRFKILECWDKSQRYEFGDFDCEGFHFFRAGHHWHDPFDIWEASDGLARFALGGPDRCVVPFRNFERVHIGIPGFGIPTANAWTGWNM